MLTLALLLFLQVTSAIQQAGQPAGQRQPETKPADQCTIEGVVLKASTGEPLKKAVVSLRKVEGQDSAKSATTDASGHFELKAIDPGRYMLQATRNGYARESYGQRAPSGPGTVLTLSPGQHVKDVVFRLIPAAVIAGHIYDEDGEPVANVQVQALKYQFEDGRRNLAPVGWATSNDLGEYRLYGLAPGQYYVSATYTPSLFGQPAAEGGYAPTYYPGTSDPARAAALEARAGDELIGTDITLLAVRTYTLKGRVYDSVNSRPGVRATVMLMPRGTQSYMATASTFVQDTQGAFELHGVSPGSYYLVAMIFDGGKRYNARQSIEVSTSDIEGISLVLSAGIELKGRVRLEGRTDWDMSSLSVMLMPRDQHFMIGTSQAMVKSDGTFSLTNVGDGDYRIQIWELPPDVYLKSAQLGEEDVLDSVSIDRAATKGSLELVLSANGGQIGGTVVKEQKPFSGATVVLVPDAPRR